MSAPTLNSLFFSGAEGGVADSDASLIDLKGEIEQQLPKISFKSVRKELDAKIGEVLNTGIDDVLIAAWKKYRGFQDYADPQKHPPEETILVPLAKHTIQSAHRPHVDLKIKDMQIGSVQLDVRLALELEGVVLKVQAGRILDVRAGSCKASGSLKCSVESKVGAKELLSLEKETPKFQLRGAIPLGDGIAIPPPGGPTES